MMTVESAIAQGEATTAPLNDTWVLRTPNSSDGLRFRQTFLITLPTGGHAEELLIDQASSFSLLAQPWIFNALDNDSPEKPDIEQFSAGLRVSLPVPRQIHSIRFANNLSPSGKTTQLFRTDADVIAEEPVASHFNGYTIHAETADLVQPAALPSGEISVMEPMAPHLQQPAARPDIASLNQPDELPAGELGVVDGRILVRLKGSGFEPLNSNSLTEFNLVTGPENLRVGIRLPALGDEVYFLPLTFEMNRWTDGGLALGDQIANQLQRLRDHLTDLTPNAKPPLLPTLLTLELIIESDAPCKFTIDEFSIRYRLARHSLTDGKPKQVLRFASEQPEQQQLRFEIPASVTLSHATIRLAGAPAAQPSDEMTAPSSVNLNSLPEPPVATGLRLNQQHRWKSPIELNEPMLTSGWDLLISTLTPNTDLHLKIVADEDGTPGSEHLASSSALLPSPHGPQRVRFLLDAPLLLQPGGYWLMVESRDGIAIWQLLAQPGSHILPWDNNEGGGLALTDLAGAASWVAADGTAAAAQQFPEITLDGQSLPMSQDGNEWVYDMSESLSGSIAGSGLLPRELSILTSGPRPVTVYPPRFEYEL